MLRPQTGVLGYSREHLWADLVRIMKCELVIRPPFTREQYMRAPSALSSAARTRLALDAGQLLIFDRKGQVEAGVGQLDVGYAIGDNFDSKALDGTNCLLACGTICQDSW